MRLIKNLINIIYIKNKKMNMLYAIYYTVFAETIIW